MEALILLFLFAFGLVIGSFLNVAILRYNTGKSLAGHSACFSCGVSLQWHHLIPLLSFLAQRGRCAFCGSKVSLQYPLVELATGLLFVKLGYLFLATLPSVIFIFYLIATSLLIIIFVYDVRHKIIPDGTVFAFIGLGFLLLMMRHSTPFNSSNAAIDFISALLIFMFFFSLWYFSKGTWMGLGDGKLALGMSLFLPWGQNLSAIVLSFWIGAVCGLLLIAYERIKTHRTPLWGPQRGVLCVKYSMQSELPFAPFMIIGFFIVLFTKFDLISLLFL